MADSKRFLATACTAFVLILSGPARGWASEPIGWEGVLSSPYHIQASPFTEGLNPNVPVADRRLYGALWFALPYTPSFSYLIDRVEFIHGERTGTVTIQIRTNNGGVPSNIVLTQGSHQLQEPVGFQGADMPPAPLTAGTSYWVVFQVVDSSQASVGEHGQGAEIPYLYGSNGSTWNGTAPTEVWIARFYGDATTPVADITWGAIKARYRGR